MREDRAETVLESTRTLLDSNPLGHCSSQQVVDATGLPSRTVRKILRETLGMYPCHMASHQAINEIDKPQRIGFAQWILDETPRSSFMDR